MLTDNTSFSLPDIEALKKIIRDAAREEILTRFNSIAYEIKADGSLVTEADLEADKRIRNELSSAYSDIAFLSEEMELEEQENLLKNSSHIWILDPLDGTSNFAAGLPLFASSLALVVEGEILIGITYDPIRDEMFSAIKNQGAWLNDKVLRSKPCQHSFDKSLAIIDFKRIKSKLARRLIKKKPYKSHRNIGASVLELAWIAANRGQLFLHGGMKLWDMAAGSLIIAEAGGYSSTLNGEDVFKATMSPRSVVASPDKALFDQWFAFIRDEYFD